MQNVYINLPVADLAKSRHFYQGLGYEINEAFSNETAACVVLSPHIYFMIMQKDRFATFAPQPVADANASTSVLIALDLPERAMVDEMVDKVIKHGGRDNGLPQEYDFMFSRSISDPDGHVIEYFWMDASAMAPEPN